MRSPFAPPNIFGDNSQSLDPDTVDDQTHIANTDTDMQDLDAGPHTGNRLNTRAGKSAVTSDVSDEDSDDDYKSLPPSRDELDDASVPGGSATPLARSSPQPPAVPKDLSKVVKGMYRFLDLINEEGNGGLVDKIIIAQDSLREFINTLSPGAYGSLTKVDFKALDRLMIKPTGVYGSKEELVRFLRSIGSVDETIARRLLFPIGDYSSTSTPGLRSGLYIVRSLLPMAADEQVYVLFWPEETTWDDSAIPAVSRNRVTFMRYLTKICDQVVSLISAEHSEALVWHDGEDEDDVSMDIENDESDRLYTFEVAKTNEQEESVTAREGFSVASQIITRRQPVNECNADPAVFTPTLLRGEKIQGIITPVFIPSETIKEFFWNTEITSYMMEEYLKESLLLSEGLDDSSLSNLLKLSLERRFPRESATWKAEKDSIARKSKGDLQTMEATITERLKTQFGQLTADLREAVVDKVLKIFPSLQRQRLSKLATIEQDPASSDGAAGQDRLPHIERLSHLWGLYPDLDNLFSGVIREANFAAINGRDFRASKEKLIIVQRLLLTHKDLGSSQRRALIDTIMMEGSVSNISQLLTGPAKESERKGGFLRPLWALVVGSDMPKVDCDNIIKEAKELALKTPDPKFLSSLKGINDDDLKTAVFNAEDEAYNVLSTAIDQQAKKLANKVRTIQEEDCKRQVRLEVANDEAKAQSVARVAFIRNVNSHARTESKTYFYIDHLELVKRGYSTPVSYQLTGRRESPQTPEIECQIYILNLSTDDAHSLQLDSSFVPTPRIDKRLGRSFRIPVQTSIKYAQLLEHERILLVLVEGDTMKIYLSSLTALDVAIKGKKFVKLVHLDRTGPDFVVAFDESTRLLAICAPIKLQLHIFVFDESFRSLQSQGSAVHLVNWYNPGTTVVHACFVSGSEEILIVDSSAHARIFSLITMQFRPASVQLQQIPDAVYSSPDASCLLVLQSEDAGPRLIAYHWSTFGSTEGTAIAAPDFPVDGAVLTSMVNRNIVHLIGLDVPSHRCQSIALDITRKVTEFMFKEKGGRNSSAEGSRQTVHNCLIDCHGDVWRRFPVLAAVGRRAITSSSERRRKALMFVTQDRLRPFESYFSDMISTFEKTTRKPTGQELSAIQVSAVDFGEFESRVVSNTNWDISRFRAGEWLVDMLCLIPIHIAVCKDNRFVPLKDGVSSAALERSLLGAEVNRIVDSLSFGWYESIFQSYLARKPVKVVSSMGEQSVGKSFALNHLVDTSFAGSAMRTTEGVWMSVTPTDDTLIVALDFEGVHSLERSAQEDTLLVLFNTAISNLVLFRNNFALSRDITDLFQSFQASSTVLDPAANPSLFQSTLIIIIKDVVDSDKAEVTREFSLKFQRIVHEEQDSNFISRLHAGKLNIIPWPVIESKEFYRLFPTLKKRLDQQKLTHHAAGEFLHTLKTLMAKLKANDWGALSQTMAAHRAKSLLALLPVALETGFSEVEPESEPLKNMDTDTVIDIPDTSALFFITGVGLHPDLHERRLAALRRSWDQHPSRQLVPDAEWSADLVLYLHKLVDMRIEHVREWLNSNLSRFQASHASIEEVRRTLRFLLNRLL